MNIYSNPSEAVGGLHSKGFTENFQLFGNDLLWVEEKILIRPEGFVIMEYHGLIQPNGNTRTCLVFGILALNYNVKGILLKTYKGYANITPPGLIDKLHELKAQASMNYRGIFCVRN